MALKQIIWNTLHRAQPQKQITADVTITPTCAPGWKKEDNVQQLVSRAYTLSKLRSNGEEDYEEEWATIGHMVSTDTSEFGLHAGRIFTEKVM